MTDLEKAVSKWLPEVWSPGRKCPVERLWPREFNDDNEDKYHCPCGYETEWIKAAPDAPIRERCVHRAHNTACPPTTPELGFRLLEAMRAKMVVMLVLTSDMCTIVPYPTKRHVLPTFKGEDPDPLTAIIKAAAALAEKGQP